MALSGALVGLGCGDDSVAPDGPMPDASGADRPVDGHPIDGTSMSDAGPSITIAAVELHGSVPGIGPGGSALPVMKAAVNVSTTPADFVPDVGSGGVPGCSAFAYDLTASTPKLPPATYNIGSITVTTYTGEPLHTAHATTMCTLGAGGYDCDFPDLTGAGSGNYIEVTSTGTANPMHWIAPGDRLTFNVAGGSGIAALPNFQMPTGSGAADNFSTAVTAKQGNVNVTGCVGDNDVRLDGNSASTAPPAFTFNNDLLVKFDCGGAPCGLVAVSLTASQTDPRKGANATCTAIISSATSNCIKIPAAELGVLNYTGWSGAAGAKIQVSVVHFGLGFTQTPIAGAAGATIGAARGAFFLRGP
jgi:hypothetical protein